MRLTTERGVLSVNVSPHLILLTPCDFTLRSIGIGREIPNPHECLEERKRSIFHR